QFPDNKIEILSGENMESTVLHFAVLKNPVSKIVLLNPLQTNTDLVKTEYYDPKPAFNMVPGSFSFYDFNDLVKTLPANSVKFFTPEKGTEILKYLNLD
ncbi:MAG TPA: hypothetical protein P5210_12170, partial [Draconibacterium sp.]|nr:hypothetical protein [Draconibacterium sp.]HRX12403.1 hypothetical protein [Draconibacterium sp.]